MIRTKKLLSLILALIFAILPVMLGGTIFAQAADTSWVTSWGTSPVNGSVSITGFALQDLIPANATIRTELTVTTGGSKLRLHFSNQYGAAAVTISEVGIARTDGEGKAKIVNGTQSVVTFNNKRAVTIPAGKDVWSDVLNFSTNAMERLSVSMFFDNTTYITTTGLSNGRTFLGTRNLIPSTTPSKVDYVSMGGYNEINISSGTITYHTIPFLCDIESYSYAASPATAVFIGDSTLVNDTYLYYAQKLVNAGASGLGIINEAVIGNKLLSKGTGLIGNLYGEALLDRFNRDVLQKPNVKYVFVKIGLNDILHQFTKSMTNSVPHYSTDDIIAGYKSLITIAHRNDIKIYFFSKSAWKGYGRNYFGQTDDLVWSKEAQAMCDALDAWLKSDNGSDGYIDCAPLADPNDAAKLRAAFTPDGAHLTTVGAIALADLIPTEFVKINSKGIKTAAELNGIDPYTVKAENKEASTEKQEEPTTATPDAPLEEEPATNAPVTTEPATQAPTTTAPAAETTTAVPAIAPVTEVPSTFNYTEPTTVITPMIEPDVGGNTRKTGNNQDIRYQVQDIGLEDQRTNSSLIYIFILFSAAVVTGTLVLLTVGKRKEAEI